MPHKFKIGDVVSYYPSDRMLSTARGTYTVAGHMPVQDGRQPVAEHKGEPIRFSLNDTEFVKTRLKLTVPKMAKTKGGRTAARLPAQEDVLK